MNSDSRDSSDDIRDINDLFREITGGAEPRTNENRRDAGADAEDEYEVPRTRVESREYEDEFLVVAELLGFGREDTEYEIDGERLKVRAENVHGSYSESVGLPSGVDVADPDESYSNGVLEIRFEKK
ncbi:MAG: Hsp20/alpha crystallin family protein [Halobacteria archaeon]|nr:Hsp20/alpha crystallin family protein [Halobacteria archaeon]